jgi:hypothetical protein
VWSSRVDRQETDELPLLNLAQEEQDRRHLLSPAVIDGHLSVLSNSAHHKVITRNSATQKNIANHAASHS